MRLVLGAAQFGGPYGVTRPTEHVVDLQLRAIAQLVAEHRIDLIDTAEGYGVENDRLAIFRDTGASLQTKLSDTYGEFDLAHLTRRFGELSELSTGGVVSVLAHGARQVLGSDGQRVRALLDEARASGLVARVGVSVYDHDELHRVLDQFRPDVVQVPLSVADQRLLHSGDLQMLVNAAIVVQVRSVFLQGLLLSSDAGGDRWPEPTRHALSRFKRAVADPARACFGFVHDAGCADEVVVGVHSAEQLGELLQAWHKPQRGLQWEALRFEDGLVDPRCWAPL